MSITGEEKKRQAEVELEGESATIIARKISATGWLAKPQVVSFCAEHPDTVMLLLDIKTHLSNIFGKELKKITLDLFNDPDEDEQWLNVNVYTSLPPAKAVERLNRFDEEWWHRVDNEAKYLINVDVRF